MIHTFFKSGDTPPGGVILSPAYEALRAPQVPGETIFSAGTF